MTELPFDAWSSLEGDIALPNTNGYYTVLNSGAELNLTLHATVLDVVSGPLRFIIDIFDQNAEWGAAFVYTGSGGRANVEPSLAKGDKNTTAEFIWVSPAVGETYEVIVTLLVPESFPNPSARTNCPRVAALVPDFRTDVSLESVSLTVRLSVLSDLFYF